MKRLVCLFLGHKDAFEPNAVLFDIQIFKLGVRYCLTLCKRCGQLYLREKKKIIYLPENKERDPIFICQP